MLASLRRPTRRGLFALAGLALALALPQSLDASVVIPATLDELAGEAHVIVYARVARVDARQAPGTLRVERVVTLAVVRALKGSPAEALQLVLPGGTYGRYRTVVPGVPEIAEGEEAVLFLRPSPTGATHLVGFTQGVMRVRIDPATGQRRRRPRDVGSRRTGRAWGHQSRTAAAGDDRGAHRAGGPRPAAGAPVRRALFVTAAFVAVAIVPSAAYMRFGLSINGTNTVLRWPGAIPYRVSDAELADGISAAALDQALQRAFRAWEGVASADVRFTRQGFTSGRPSDDDASNVFGFERRPNLERTLRSPGLRHQRDRRRDRRGRRPVQRRAAVDGGRERLLRRLRSAGRRPARDRPRARPRAFGDRRDGGVRERPPLPSRRAP